MAQTSCNERLARHGDRLRRQLVRLYGRTHDVDALFVRVERVLRARSAGRPSDLCALDEQRAQDPDWFVDPSMIGYSTYVDRFAGTIAGVAEGTDYLRSLGVRYLHLLSVLKPRQGDSDGGFAVADYLQTAPSLGNMNDLASLARDLRRAGISLCIDFALNHSADDHIWARAAKAGGRRARDFYLVIENEAEVKRREAELREVFPQTAPGNFTHVPELDGWVWTTFYPFQWDLNWANPELFLAMLDNLLQLANHGVEAFRLDSIAFLWKEAGTDCRNRPETHYIVRALRAALDIVAPGVLLKGEAIVPTRDVLPYFGADEGDGYEPECHLVYHNSLMVAGWVGLVEGDATAPTIVLSESANLPENANWLSYARCHDDIGWGALAADLEAVGSDPETRLKRVAATLEGKSSAWGRGEAFQADGDGLHGTNGTMASLAGLEAAGDDRDARETAFARIRLLNALMIASGGLSTIYMGDEIGMLNDRSYLSDPERAHEGRWLHRPKMDWSAIGGGDARRITGDIARLREARIACGGAGAAAPLAVGNDAVLALPCGSDAAYLNFSGETQIAEPPHGPWLDRLSGTAGEGRVELAPYGVIWARPR